MIDIAKDIERLLKGSQREATGASGSVA